MTRYDDLIRQQKGEAESRKIREENQKKAEADRKRRFIQAFIDALPEFYEALLKNDNWREFEYFHRKFIHYGKDKMKGITFIHVDSDGFGFAHYWMGKNGKYYRSESWKSYADTIISAEELAERLYSIVIRSAHYYPNAKLKEAVKKDDFDEAAFQYLSDVIAYNNRYL